MKNKTSIFGGKMSFIQEYYIWDSDRLLNEISPVFKTGFSMKEVLYLGFR